MTRATPRCRLSCAAISATAKVGGRRPHNVVLLERELLDDGLPRDVIAICASISKLTLDAPVRPFRVSR